MDENRLPFAKAVIWILVSTLLISGTSLMGWLYFLQLKNKRFHDDQYKITSIIQNLHQEDALTTTFLAEKLDLSVDNPINLYQFNVKEGEKKLLNESIFKRVNIKKILPGTLYVNYELRKPMAILGDFSNTLIDSKGVLFPFQPFFSVNQLSVFYLGLEKSGWKWGDRLSQMQHFDLGKKILNDFKKMNLFGFIVESIDLSQLASESDGKREIILKLKIDGKSFYLRLGLNQWELAITNFLTLYEWKFNQSKMGFKNQTLFDFRIPHLGFIQEKEGNQAVPA
ncbi:MAG: hypothetical protein Q8K60_07705 [Parachlamydiaceae bacterium]|nr:hypothetical protein [Parachlamydiaceae bacterium]